VAVSAVAFLARALAPTHRRFVEAARTALKATITTGIAAIVQTLGPFGPLFAFRIGQPGISFGLFEGGLTIVSAAAMQAAIVPITGKLLDYPGLIMAFLFALFATIAYLLSNTRLFLILGLVAIGTITTLYAGIFAPGQIGWGSTYTFDGILAATLVMVAVDTWIWPSPAEPRLLESVAADLERSECARKWSRNAISIRSPRRCRLHNLHRGWLRTWRCWSRSRNTRTRRPSVLLVCSTQWLPPSGSFWKWSVSRCSLRNRYPDEIRQTYRHQLKVVLSELDAALARRAEEVLAGIQGSRNSAEQVPHLHGLIRQLKDASAQILAGSETATTFGASNFVGFVDAMDVIENLLVTPLFGGVATEATEVENTAGHQFFDSDRFRF